MAAPALAHPDVHVPAASRPGSLTSPRALPPSRRTSDFVYGVTMLGIPGSMISAVLTMTMMMQYGEGKQLLMWAGLAVLWTAYFGIMAIGWLAEANE